MSKRSDPRLLPVMVRLLEELSKMRVPIVFKGAVVLKTALLGSGVGIERATEDIDGDWVSSPPTMEQLETLLGAAASNTGEGLTVKASRVYSDVQSAGFKVYWPDGTYAFKLDISIRQNQYYLSYLTVNGVQFVGASPMKMFSDKLITVSTNKLFRRVKDIVDLFLLSSLTGYSTVGVHSINSSLCRSIGDFDAFLHRAPELIHAYGKMDGVEPKPDFQVLYGRVYHFIEPFILKSSSNLLWNGNSWIVQ